MRKRCPNCKHRNVLVNDFPCYDCYRKSHWEAKEESVVPKMGCHNCDTACTPSKQRNGMCCDWQPKLPKAKSVCIIAKPKSVVPPIKVRILELSIGTNIVLLDDGRDFTKLYREFYIEKQKLSYDMDIMEYLVKNGVTILEAQQDHMDAYITDLINWVNKLREKAQESGKKQGKGKEKPFIKPCDCPRCS